MFAPISKLLDVI